MTESPHANNELFPKVNIGARLREYGFTLLWGSREKISGNPKVGTLSIIKQIHNDYQDPHRLARESPEKHKELVAYQKAIYMELKRQKSQDIFVEWIRDIHLKNGDWEKTGKELKKLLENTEMRDTVFAHYGGAIAYLIENPSAKVHHTENEDIINEMEKYQGDTVPKWLIEDREGYAIKQVQSFLSKNPGKKVALVFWSQHDFRNNLTKAYSTNPPQAEIVSFPDIARRYLEK